MQATCEKCRGTEEFRCPHCPHCGNLKNSCSSCNGSGKAGCPVCVHRRLAVFVGQFSNEPAIIRIIVDRKSPTIGKFLVISANVLPGEGGFCMELRKKLEQAARPYGVSIVSEFFFDNEQYVQSCFPLNGY